ncbi:hypothetical protein D3C77_412080 [compost metagenome]
MSSKYEKLEALYCIDLVNEFLQSGWELVGEPTNSSHPDTGLPATCWTMGKLKAARPIPKMDLAGANRGLS